MKSRLFIISFFLLLLVAPLLIVNLFDYYPNGYTYKEYEGKLKIFELTTWGQTEKTYVDDSYHLYAKYETPSWIYINKIQTWYKSAAEVLGYLLGGMFLFFLPRSTLSYVLRPLTEIKEEFQQDHPSIYNRLTSGPREIRLELKEDFPRIFDREFPTIPGAVLFILSILIAIVTIQSYPSGEVAELQHLLKDNMDCSK